MAPMQWTDEAQTFFLNMAIAAPIARYIAQSAEQYAAHAKEPAVSLASLRDGIAYMNDAIGQGVFDTVLSDYAARIAH